MTSGAPPGQDYFQCYGTKNGQYWEATEFWMLGQRINNWWLIFQSNAWLPGWEICHDCEVGAGRCIQHWILDAFKYWNTEFDTRSNPRCHELIGIIQWGKPPKCWEIRALEALRRASGIVFYNRTRLMLLKLWIRMIARWCSCWLLLSTELSKRHMMGSILRKTWPLRRCSPVALVVQKSVCASEVLPSRLHSLLKIHKVPFHSIIKTIGIPSYTLAKQLADILKLYSGGTYLFAFYVLRLRRILSFFWVIDNLFK